MNLKNFKPRLLMIKTIYLLLGMFALHGSVYADVVIKSMHFTFNESSNVDGDGTSGVIMYLQCEFSGATTSLLTTRIAGGISSANTGYGNTNSAPNTNYKFITLTTGIGQLYNFRKFSLDEESVESVNFSVFPNTPKDLPNSGANFTNHKTILYQRPNFGGVEGNFGGISCDYGYDANIPGTYKNLSILLPSIDKDGSHSFTTNTYFQFATLEKMGISYTPLPKPFVYEGSLENPSQIYATYTAVPEFNTLLYPIMMCAFLLSIHKRYRF